MAEEELVALRTFIGDVKDSKSGKVVTKKFQPGNIVVGGSKEDNDRRVSRGIVGSEADLKKVDPSLKKGGRGVWYTNPELDPLKVAAKTVTSAAQKKEAK